MDFKEIARIQEEEEQKKEERLQKIEKDIREMQKKWIEQYEQVLRMIHEK